MRRKAKRSQYQSWLKWTAMKPYPHNELCNFIATWLHKSCLIRQYFTSQTQSLCTLVWLDLTHSFSFISLSCVGSIKCWIALLYCRLVERYQNQTHLLLQPIRILFTLCFIFSNEFIVKPVCCICATNINKIEIFSIQRIGIIIYSNRWRKMLKCAKRT